MQNTFFSVSFLHLLTCVYSLRQPRRLNFQAISYFHK
jgi:hypothetical protein